VSQRICLRCELDRADLLQMYPVRNRTLPRGRTRRSRPPGSSGSTDRPKVEPSEIGDELEGGGSLPAAGVPCGRSWPSSLALIAVAFDRIGASGRPSRATGRSGPPVASDGSSAGSSALALPPTGRLVYRAEPMPVARSGCWICSRVPSVGTRLDRTPVELVDASGAARGWIGIESRARTASSSPSPRDPGA
jgi:hypothetical protein